MINQAILEELDNEFINSDMLHLRDEWDHYKYKKLFVPRVTHIIHTCTLDTEALTKWANSLGYRHINSNYAREQAALTGTAIHNAIEDFLLNKSYPKFDTPMDEQMKQSIKNGIDGFISFWENYRFKDLVADVSLEQTLVTPYFGGTYDMIITLTDGRKFLYDFKTSNNIRDSYFVQLAAYRFALLNYYNTKLDGVAILMINKKTPSCKEYMLDLNIKENDDFMNLCERTFMSMLYTYYNCIAVKISFKEIIK